MSIYGIPQYKSKILQKCKQMIKFFIFFPSILVIFIKLLKHKITVKSIICNVTKFFWFINDFLISTSDAILFISTVAKSYPNSSPCVTSDFVDRYVASLFLIS